MLYSFLVNFGAGIYDSEFHWNRNTKKSRFESAKIDIVECACVL